VLFSSRVRIRIRVRNRFSVCSQWRRLHGAWQAVPSLLQMAGHGGTVSRRTANKKLTKLYFPSQNRSPKQIVLLEPKMWRGTTKKNFAPYRCPPPQFSNRSGATVWLVCTRIRATLGCILVTDRKKKYPYKQTETGFRMEIETGCPSARWLSIFFAVKKAPIVQHGKNACAYPWLNVTRSM